MDGWQRWLHAMHGSVNAPDSRTYCFLPTLHYTSSEGPSSAPLPAPPEETPNNRVAMPALPSSTDAERYGSLFVKCLPLLLISIRRIASLSGELDVLARAPT